MLPIAVVGCTLQIIGLTPGTAQITSSPSTKVKAENKFVYRGTVMISVSGCTQGVYTQTAPVTGSFNNTATKVKADNQLVLLENDTTSPITVELQKTVSPFDKITVPITVKVLNANQTKVKAN
jgi:hypothetical protein